jgi:predicted Zn-dependent protease
MTRRALITAALVVALAVAPFVSRESGAQIFVTQKDVEAELRVMWMTLKRGTPQHPDPKVQRLAQCIAYSIIDVIPAEFQNLNWEVIVFDNDDVNAMVTPEGKIAVFGGLMDLADSPDMLAAVIGHEVSHLTRNHVSQRIRRGLATGVATAIGGTVTGMDSSGVATVFFQYPFQREQETEADISGMEYMARAGYNPAAAMEFWRAMNKRADEEVNRPPEFLSTHPDPEYRMTDIAKSLAPALAAYHSALDAGVRPRCSL